jgi:myo-inositol 2-dehydrogenase/D-chiro-inositol 1-dehydrogenase
MLRIGLVGAGHIAKTHARQLAELPEVGIAGAFDCVPEKAQALAERYDATAFDDLESMLRAADAIYVCTPPKFHREAATRATEAGVHVLCEKPLAVTVEDAEAIQEAVERAGIVFMVGFNFRFMPPFAQLKELAASGEFGDLYSFWGLRLLWSPHPPPNWRTDPRFLCGMTVESLSHDFDYLRWVAGDVASVAGKVATSRSDLDGYDNIIAAVMTLRSGAMATIHASWASHARVHQVGVIGTRGSAVCERDRVRYRLEGDPADRVIECNRAEDQALSYLRESEHFVECIRTGTQPIAAVGDGVATVRISHAVLRSSQEGCVVRLDR